MLKLKAEKREKSISLNPLKELKGVVYGAHLDKNILVKIKYSDFVKVYNEAGTSHIIDLEIEGKNYDVLIKDFQLDPVKDFFIHIDFYVITKGEEIEVSIPFVFEGVAPATGKGAMVNEILSEIKVKTIPSKIPENIKIDLSVLENEGDSIRLEDLKLPEGVSFATEHLDEVVVTASTIKEEIEDDVSASVEEEVMTEKSE